MHILGLAVIFGQSQITLITATSQAIVTGVAYVICALKHLRAGDLGDKTAEGARRRTEFAEGNQTA